MRLLTVWLKPLARRPSPPRVDGAFGAPRREDVREQPCVPSVALIKHTILSLQITRGEVVANIRVRSIGTSSVTINTYTYVLGHRQPVTTIPSAPRTLSGGFGGFEGGGRAFGRDLALEGVLRRIVHCHCVTVQLVEVTAVHVDDTALDRHRVHPDSTPQAHAPPLPPH